MDQSLTNESTRRVNLEDLSKEDLVKKCTHLLAIAQKAKQAKTILQEENIKLKELADNNVTVTNTATHELIENLTQQKLSLVTNNEDLKAQNESLKHKLQLSDSELVKYREKLGSCDNENISYRRQINRLTNENDQLLNDLDALEKQIEKLKEIGTLQQEQLLEVDKANSLESNEITTNELQRMLGISLEEVKRLKSDNISLERRVENLQINLTEKDRSIIVISEELKAKNRIIEDLTEGLRTLKDESKESNIQSASIIDEHEKNIQRLEKNNIELKEKVKLYHSKIIKFATTAKQLREDKNNVLDLFKAYTDQVKEWKEQLKNAEIILLKHVGTMENECYQLKQENNYYKKNENELKNKLTQISSSENNIQIIQKQYEAQELVLSQKVDEIERNNSKLLKKVEKLNEIIETLKEENQNLKQAEQSSKDSIDKYNKVLEEKLIIENDLKQVLTNQENELKVIKDEFENEKLLFEMKIKEMEESNSHLVINLSSSSKIIENYERSFESLKEEHQILIQKQEDSECDNRNIREENILLRSKLEASISSHENENTEQLRQMEQVLQNTVTLFDQCRKNLETSLIENDKIKEELNNEIKIIQKENNNLRRTKDDLMAELDTLNGEKKTLTKELKENTNEFNKTLEETLKKIQQYEILISDLQNQIRSLEELGKRSGEEIKSLVEENKQLLSINETIQDKLNEIEFSRSNVTHSCSQTDEMSTSTNNLEEQITDLRRENTELLSEMNEMNQAIKERGENISKLQAHCEEVLKKLQIYEAQANRNVDSIAEKEKIIEDLSHEIEKLRSNRDCNVNLSAKEEIDGLKSEVETLKEKISSNLETISHADNDTMSTSTISRTEEINRMKDLDGSWEERYGKLRNLAVKLKGKIRELTQTVNKQQGENEDLLKKLTLNIKTIQNVQSESDKLQDELENSKKECKQYLNRLNTVANDISKDKQSLADKEEIISGLRQELEGCRNEKLATEKWKKQVSAKIQTLRKEVEANNLMTKEFESRFSKLTSDLDAKEQQLKTEIESHKHTKNLLDQSNNECKKNSVLTLEMQDFERSVKETSKRLEKQLEEISNLKGQVESHKTTITALREQNKLLEERLTDEEQNIVTVTSELSASKKKISNLEEEISQKIDKIQSLTQLLETNRSETEELSTELSKVIAEHQKANNTLKTERDHLRSQMLGLQQSLREAQDSLALKTDELTLILKEYEGYKVRAQSVLRQNQSRDVGLEEKMSEEVASLTTQNSALKSQLEQNREYIEKLEVDNKNLVSGGDINLKKLKELEGDIEELKIQYAELSAKHEKTISESADTVRSLKVHADTLSQCYRQQISEQEVRHNREIIELQSRLEKAPSPTESPPVLPTMTREECEGSESIESNLTMSVHPVPLERLLGSDSEHEIDRIRKKIGEAESKVAHLTALLSDTEQDLVKHVQMTKLLKEEIRRQQRSEEREKHAENLEYLKNVVFKFVTLNSGDERTRLVPVLNTILKLSPEEAKQLTLVAKGETSLKGWANYLPVWSSPSKPQ